MNNQTHNPFATYDPFAGKSIGFDPLQEKKAHDEWLKSEEKTSEYNRKMRIFQMAIERGAPDPLIQGLSPVAQLQSKLHRVADAAMELPLINEEEKLYQSVIGMVYTLVEDGRLPELYRIIHKAFPEYHYPDTAFNSF